MGNLIKDSLELMKEENLRKLMSAPADRVAAAREEAPIAIPEIDPGLREQVGRQRDLANQFRQNLGSYTQGNMALAGDQGRRDLAQRLTGIKQGASARGLLYSGLRSGEEAGAYSDFASGLSQARSDINQRGEDLARGYDMAAVNSGLNLQRAEQERQNQIYRQALDRQRNKITSERAGVDAQRYNQEMAQQDRAASQQAYGALGSGLGTLAGTAIGASKAPKEEKK